MIKISGFIIIWRVEDSLLNYFLSVHFWFLKSYNSFFLLFDGASYVLLVANYIETYQIWESLVEAYLLPFHNTNLSFMYVLKDAPVDNSDDQVQLPGVGRRKRQWRWSGTRDPAVRPRLVATLPPANITHDNCRNQTNWLSPGSSSLNNDKYCFNIPGPQGSPGSSSKIAAWHHNYHSKEISKFLFTYLNTKHSQLRLINMTQSSVPDF